MSPPTCPSCVGMISFFYVVSLVVVTWSFYRVTGLGVGLFFVVALPCWILTICCAP
jgi:hypothetical protein